MKATVKKAAAKKKGARRELVDTESDKGSLRDGRDMRGSVSEPQVSEYSPIRAADAPEDLILGKL
jgi:hypothetical protein